MTATFFKSSYDVINWYISITTESTHANSVYYQFLLYLSFNSLIWHCCYYYYHEIFTSALADGLSLEFE